jgi:DNA repair protein RadC
MKKLKDLSESDRPREKLQARGPEALSDLELQAILLGSGTRDSNVLTVAGRILDHIVFNQKGYYSFLEMGLLRNSP